MKKSHLLAVAGSLALAHGALGQAVRHTYDDLTDGFLWLSPIFGGDCLFAFDFPYDGELTYCNYTNNPLMVSGDYVAAGNASRIDGPAIWGNPRSGEPFGTPYVEIDFSALFEYDGETGDPISEVTEVRFDFAWATSAGSPVAPPAIDSVFVEIWSDFGDQEAAGYFLDEIFPHGLGGSAIGYSGQVVVDTSLVPNISFIAIYFDDLAPPGAVAEFAIDNLEVYLDGETGGGGGQLNGPQEVYLANFRGEESLGYGSNALKGTGLFSFDDFVANNSGVPTTFTTTFSSASPLMFDPDPASRANVPIGVDELYAGGGRWQIDTDTAPSGGYSGIYTVVNNSDPTDPDNMVDVTFELLDPPALGDNTGLLIDPDGTNQVTLSNAAAGPHAGAIRASVVVTGITIDSPYFTLSGISVDDELLAGDTFTGTVGFDGSTSPPPGTYVGTLTMSLEMDSPNSSFLNRSQPVPDRVWNLSVTVGGSAPTPPEVLGFSRSGGLITITYQSVAGEVFGVLGGADIEGLAPLPDTVVGDGTVKTYTHTPPAGSKRFFYQMTRTGP